MNRFVDIYANILPDMATVGHKAPTKVQALTRLEQAEAGSVKTILAAPLYTPERYPSIDRFFEMRDERCAALNDRTAKHSHPVKVLGGAVLHYDPSLLKLGDKIRRFSLGASRYMLIDLPNIRLTPEFFETMTRLQVVSGLTPILADFDRFYDAFTLEDFFALREAGILLQISADGITALEKRKLSLYLIGNENIHFIASGSQPPEEPLRIPDAMRMAQRNLPVEIYRRIKNNSGMLLSDASPSEFF
ncbi:MAG: hypothetical protein IKL87_04475 [Oscillospiraceae bacterium]|nr:hypothetical protein [Oscillospiraceae bacterium]